MSRLNEGPLENIDFNMVRDDLIGFPMCELPAGYHFRAYRPGDQAVWVALHQAAEPFIDVTQELFARQFGHALDALRDRMFFVENDEGEAAGSITAWWEREEYNPTERGRIHWVVVDPRHQRRGLAKAMMTRAMRRLAESHTRAMLGTSSMRPWAVKVYLDFGFHPEPRQLNDPVILAGWQQVQSLLRHPLLDKWLDRADNEAKERNV